MVKNSKVLFGLLIVIVLTGILFSTQHKSHASVASAPLAAPTPEGAARYLRSSRNYQDSLRAMSETVSPGFTKDCVEYFSHLEQLNLLDPSQTEEKLTYQLLPKRPEKCTWKDSFLDRMEADFNENCRPEKDLSAPISDECSQKLFFLRAGITRILLKDKPISEITDLHQLVDLLFSEFVVNGPNGSPDFAKMREASDRMLELNPKLSVAAKTSAYSSAIEGIMSTKNGNLSADAAEAIWKKSELALKRAEDLRPNDPSLDDAKAAIVTRGFDPDKTLEYGNESVAQRPNEGRGYFLRSYGEWKKNLREESVRDLKRAIELSPQEAGYSQVLTEIQKPGATVESFQGQFKFAVSNDDFRE